MIALFNILVNQKRGISVKEKQTAQPRNVRESYTHQNTQIHAPKKKKFLYSNEGTIDYNQQCHPLHLRNKQVQAVPSKNKEKEEREKKTVRTRRGRRRKRRRKGEGKIKRGRETEKERKREWKREGEGEERREREIRGENGENGTKSTPLSPDAFLSTKLGNNITLIKGKLGKNITPTGRGPSEPSQNP